MKDVRQRAIDAWAADLSMAPKASLSGLRRKQSHPEMAKFAFDTFRPLVASARVIIASAARSTRSAGPQYVTVNITGEIGAGKLASAKNVRAQLSSAPHAACVHLIINSHGGNVAEAFGIYAALREHPGAVSAVGVGKVVSAAVIPFLAGEHRRLTENAALMVHTASIEREHLGQSRLTASRLRNNAELVAAADDQIIALLVDRTGFERSFFVKEMKDDRPMRPIDVLISGIAHEVDGCAASRKCDARWPASFNNSLSSGTIVGIPQHLSSQNYLRACRVRAALTPSRGG